MHATTKNLARAAVCATGALSLVAGVGHTVLAAAPPLQCGMTITVSTTLRADLVDCADDGIVIGAPGITLDLNGHRIDGDGVTGVARPDAGVRNEGFANVTVQGGSVERFDQGVVVTRAPQVTTRRLIARNNFLGIAVDGSSANRIEQNQTRDNKVGILVRDSDATVMRHNTSLRSEFIGIVGLAITHGVISHNTVVSSDLDVPGIQVDDNSTDNVIDHNTVSDSELPLSVTGDRNQIASNWLHDNRSGIIVIGNDNRATANLVTDALGCGPDGGCGIGISVEGGDRNIISDNRIARTFDNGMRVDVYVGSATGTQFVRNEVTQAGHDGIAVGTDQVGIVEQTLVTDNRVTGSTADGFHIDDGTATLARNTAVLNGGLGIEAVAGVSDGGGNRAKRNGDPAQCTNVAC